MYVLANHAPVLGPVILFLIVALFALLLFWALYPTGSPEGPKAPQPEGMAKRKNYRY